MFCKLFIELFSSDIHPELCMGLFSFPESLT